MTDQKNGMIFLLISFSLYLIQDRDLKLSQWNIVETSFKNLQGVGRRCQIDSFDDMTLISLDEDESQIELRLAIEPKHPFKVVMNLVAKVNSFGINIGIIVEEYAFWYKYFDLMEPEG